MFLEHVNMTVADLDRSITFYQEVLGLRVRWRGSREEPGVEADAYLLGSDPAGERHQLGAHREPQAGLLLELAQRRRGGAVVVRAGAASGKDPGAAHELLLGVALHEQHLGAIGAVAQEDKRRRRARLGDLAEVELLARWRPVHAHPRSLPARGR